MTIIEWEFRATVSGSVYAPNNKELAQEAVLDHIYVGFDVDIEKLESVTEPSTKKAEQANKPFITTGYLNLVSQEGGYVGPDWEIDNTSLADKVARHFEVGPVRYDDPSWYQGPYVPGDRPIGMVRITIERVEPACDKETR